jgi:hypothetical protein
MEKEKDWRQGPCLEYWDRRALRLERRSSEFKANLGNVETASEAKKCFFGNRVSLCSSGLS